MHGLLPLLPKKILYWYDNNKRILPWRIKTPKNKKEYYVLVSEFMLQQTQVKTVIPYFEKFVSKIPNLKTLSKSNAKQVLKLWEGLGYYRRARNLHKTAKILLKKYNAKLPKKIEEIIKNFKDQTLVVFSKKGYFYDRISSNDFKNLVLFTENVKLNDLVGEEFFVGKVKLKAHDLCKPCKYLQESLQQKNVVKEFLYTGGLRCEILSSGKICVDDQIIS